MSRSLADGPFGTVLEQIAAEHGDTLISTLRARYGFNFAPTVRSIDDLRDVLLRIDEPSRSRLLQDYGLEAVRDAGDVARGRACAV